MEHLLTTTVFQCLPFHIWTQFGEQIAIFGHFSWSFKKLNFEYVYDLTQFDPSQLRRCFENKERHFLLFGKKYCQIIIRKPFRIISTTVLYLVFNYNELRRMRSLGQTSFIGRSKKERLNPSTFKESSFV